MRRPGPGSFRLFLALVVVVHHSTPLRLGSWAVGLFFVLSGFWIAEMWNRKYRRLDWPYLEFIVSRWWRLAPVLFVTTLLAAAAMVTGLVAGDTHILGHAAWWITQPAIAGSTSVGRLLPPAWSLDVEMQFYVVAPALVLVAVRAPVPLRWAVVVATLGWCWWANAHGNAGEAPRFDVWAGIFLLGVLSSTTRWRPSRTVAWAAVATTLLAFAAAAVAPSTRSWILLRGSVDHPLTGPLAATLTIGTLLLSVPIAIATTANPSTRFDRLLGDLSYPLYLFHWLPRNWYYAHLATHPRPAVAVLLLATNIVVALIGGLAILIAVDRPVQKLRAQWVTGHLKPPVPQTPFTAASAEPFAGTV